MQPTLVVSFEKLRIPEEEMPLTEQGHQQLIEFLMAARSGRKNEEQKRSA
jgi:hypothetical protein